MAAFRKSSVIAVLIMLAHGSHPTALAADLMLDRVLVSRQDDSAILDIQFECRNRYVDHSPLTRSDRVQIRLLQVDRCGLSPISTPRRELQRPAGREMAELKELEFVRGGDGRDILLMHFERPVVVVVQQRGDLRRLTILVDTSGVAADTDLPAAPVAVAPIARSSTPTPDPDQARRAEERVRRLGRVSNAVPEKKGNYAINLASTIEPVNPDRAVANRIPEDVNLYITEFTVDDTKWYRLRLGFFVTESDAEAALRRLGSTYPDAFVVRVPSTEHKIATNNRVVAAGEPAAVDPVPKPGDASAPPVTGAAAGLSGQQLGTLMADGRQALLAGDNNRAVQIYTKVLREPENPYSQEAQEYLGLARERNGQNAHAVAEYRRYLMLYPEGDDAARVRQRLAGLVSIHEVRVETRTAATDRPEKTGPWDVHGGFAQYYRRDVSRFDDQDEVVNQSSALTDFDVNARRRGERFDFASRATLGNLYDLLGEDEGPGTSTRVYQLYADLVDNRWDASARVGRQLLHHSGVLGRFDGAHLSWSIRPDMHLNFVTGFPVITSEDSIDTDRFFYGISTDFTDVFDLVDLSLFYNTAEVEGIEDRQAVGGELRYFDDARSLVMLADYDISYSELNSFVTLGNWAFDNRVTLNAMIDFRKGPLLTTSNALIGQPVSTMEELRLIFGEEEIRRLARDRTDSLQTWSLGVSTPLFERFQVNADATMIRSEGTRASGGVAAVPGADNTYLSMTLIGSSLLMEQDTSIFGIGYSDGATADTATLTIDTRYPLGRGARFNPRFRFSRRDLDRTDSEQWIATPSLRLLYRFARRYEIELEVGGEWSTRKTDAESVDYNTYFLYMGYRADF